MHADWLQYVIAPMVVAVAGALIVAKLNRTGKKIDIMLLKIATIEYTILDYIGNGTADAYKERLKKMMDEKRYEHGI